MGYTAKKLIELAIAELGYCEKETNAQLDNKTANAGDGNWTKYARDLHTAGYYQAPKNGYAWCDMFVDWLFLQLTGSKEKGEYLECQTGLYGAGCEWSSDCYRRAGRFDKNPKPGDQIFFGKTDDEEHTGIVEKVENGKVYTIEGNASNQVKRCTYSLTSSYIVGYGHPRFDAEEETAPVVLTGEVSGYTKESVQKMYDYLMNEAPKTPDGVIHHNNITFDNHFTSAQLWVDSCYMAPPFIAVMGNVEEAVKQLRGMFRYLQCPETKVLFHNYDVGSGKFVRRLRWATGNGWALMGVARVAIEAKKRGMLDYYKELTEMGNELLDAMLKYQQTDGRFLDIMDDETSFVEGTASMMMSVYIYRGVIEGWLDKKYLEYAEKAFASVTANIDRFGILRHVCGCPHFVVEGTSCEAQAAYVMAATWREKAIL